MWTQAGWLATETRSVHPTHTGSASQGQSRTCVNRRPTVPEPVRQPRCCARTVPGPIVVKDDSTPLPIRCAEQAVMGTFAGPLTTASRDRSHTTVVGRFRGQIRG
jgi:hypothetical protein